MNIDNMKDWAKALRSGEYEQTKYGIANKRETKFCCLGVRAKQLGCVRKGIYRDPNYDGVMSDLDITGLQQSQFMHWNDVDGLTFAQIADKIDQMIAEEETKTKETTNV